MTWTQKINFFNYCDYYIDFGKDINDKFNQGLYTLEEIANSVESIDWNITNKQIDRNIIFFTNGNITMIKKNNKYKNDSSNYNIDYNLFNYNFTLELNNGKIIIINNEDGCFININGYEISEKENNGTRIIECKSPVLKKSSVALKLCINCNESIETYNIDFKTYKKDKVKGTYSLKITPEQRSLYYINKGLKYGDYLDFIVNLKIVFI